MFQLADSDIHLRLGLTAPRAGKPSIMVSDKYEVWLGNLGTAVLDLEPGELFGFGTGSYETSVVGGLAANNFVFEWL